MSNIDRVIEGCRKGDTAMQHELYRLYSPRLYLLCRRYAVDDDEAQDILIEGFTKIFKYIDKYRGSGSIEGWMQTIMLRVAMQSFHFRQRRRRIVLDEEFLDENAAVAYQPAYSAEMREALIKCLRALPDEDRLLFNLVAVEGYSFAEVGKTFEINVSTAKSRYYKIVKRMRVLLKRKLGENYLKE